MSLEVQASQRPRSGDVTMCSSARGSWGGGIEEPFRVSAKPRSRASPSCLGLRYLCAACCGSLGCIWFVARLVALGGLAWDKLRSAFSSGDEEQDLRAFLAVQGGSSIWFLLQQQCSRKKAKL